MGQSSCDVTYPMLAKHKQQSCASLLSAGTRKGRSPYRSKNYRFPPFHTRQVLPLGWYFPSSQPAAVAGEAIIADECQQQNSSCLLHNRSSPSRRIPAASPDPIPGNNQQKWYSPEPQATITATPVCQSTFDTLCSLLSQY